jgi:hypothetical protein
MVGSRVRISASSCNIGIRDANCWFDSSVLVRKFQLDLSNPFERAVALLVLFLIASHQTYVIGLSEYYDPDNRSTTNLGTHHCRVAASEDARLRPCSGFIFFTHYHDALFRGMHLALWWTLTPTSSQLGAVSHVGVLVVNTINACASNTRFDGEGGGGLRE